MRLRRRLNTVLLQWLLLFVLVAGVVWGLSLPGLRRTLVDDRLLLARTIAHSLDVTISSSLQNLGRLAAELPLPPADAASRLRAFRFQSPFGEATYLADSPGPRGDCHRAAFTRQGRAYYLVSEMNPRNSLLNTFLRGLEVDPTMHVAVIDEHGRVAAASDPAQLLQTLPGADALSDRIRAHRPLVIEDGPAALTPDGSLEPALTVMAPLQFAAWGVVIQQPTARAFCGLRATGRGLLITGLVLAIMGVLVARTLSRSVVSPIRQLSQQAAAMRSGDLSSPITVAGDFEVEVLALRRLK